MLTDAQLAWLRSVLGASTDSLDLQTRYTRLGNVRDVALEVMRIRYTTMITAPMKVNLSGVASVDWTGNATQLKQYMETIAALEPDPSAESPADEIPGGTVQIYNFPSNRRR